jgi:hypothetical protein
VGPYELGQLDERLSRLIDDAIARGHEPALEQLAAGDAFVDERGFVCTIVDVGRNGPILYRYVAQPLDEESARLEWFFAAWVLERRLSSMAAAALSEVGWTSVDAADRAPMGPALSNAADQLVARAGAVASTVAARAYRDAADVLRVEADRLIERGA